MGTYLENVPYNITTNDACDDANDSHAQAQVNEEETIYDTPLISEDEFLNKTLSMMKSLVMMFMSLMMMSPMMMTITMMSLVMISVVKTFVITHYILP